MKSTPFFHAVASFWVIFFLAACNNPNNALIKENTESFFSTTRMHNEVDQQALSTELATLLQQVIEAEKNDAMLTQSGPYPTDKPMLIEGDIFSSLYEGRTGATVQKILLNGNQAKVILRLENKPYDTQWTDTAVLIKEGNTWKIDDVLYGQNNNIGSTSLVLNNFLNACRTKLQQGPTK